MLHWVDDSPLSIGRTPLVRLNSVGDGAPATLLAKIEGRNAALSIKHRVAAAMIWTRTRAAFWGGARKSSRRPAARPE